MQIFSSFFPGWVLSCRIEIFKAILSNSISWYPSLTCIHYASFGISVYSFRGRIYSLTRVDIKLHDPCEVLARIWTAQSSPRLLPWIYSVLTPRYAEASKFTVKENRNSNRKIHFVKQQRNSNRKFHFVKEQRNSNTEISF